jgi:DNA-binding CsgD family transcriptional regulator
MESSDPDGPGGPPEAYAEGSFGSQTAERLMTAFDRLRHPMLMTDDHRRWVTGNAAACEFLHVARAELSLYTVDDFTPPSNRPGIEERFEAFLRNGMAEGWWEPYIASRETLPVEFSSTANVLPGRHLTVLVPQDEDTKSFFDHEAPWTRVVPKHPNRSPLTPREREVMTLVANGLTNDDVAERLFLSSETVKSHIHNAMGKLDAHTRAHAVAISLVTGQIAWETEN